MISFLTGLECKGVRNAEEKLYQFEDPAIGVYTITDDAKSQLGETPFSKEKVANVLGARKAKGINYPIYIEGDEDELADEDLLTLGIERAGKLVSEYPETSTDLLNGSLLNISYLLRHPADQFVANEHFPWKVYSYDRPSMVGMLDMLEAQEMIRNTGVAGAWPGGVYSTSSYGVTAKGWEKIDSLRNPAREMTKDAFVAMWFDNKTQLIFENGIDPALRECGLNVLRIDKKEHNNKICDEIVSSIRRCRVLIADFTGQRGGVYYEAGFAHGLGLPVIWICHKDDLRNLHFDTRQYNHIAYSSASELKKRLIARVRATIPNLSTPRGLSR